METNSSGDELLKTSSKETNCLETKIRGTVLYSFLALPNPRDQSGYPHIKAVIKNLTPLNYFSERHLALTTAYSGFLIKEDNCYQDLILVLEENRKKFKIQKKMDLTKIV